MASIAQIQEQSRRAILATNCSSLIINKKLLRKKLREVFYARSADDIIKIIKALDGKEFEEPTKKVKGIGRIINSPNIKSTAKRTFS